MSRPRELVWLGEDYWTFLPHKIPGTALANSALGILQALLMKKGNEENLCIVLHKLCINPAVDYVNNYASDSKNKTTWVLK